MSGIHLALLAASSNDFIAIPTATPASLEVR
jgi:hypothetical protein